MSLSLTERQRNELHVAILEYLISQPGDKFAKTIAEFKKESGLPASVELGKGLLEKKWTAVVRLQKRVQDLEATVTQLQSQRTFSDSNEGSVGKDSGGNGGATPGSNDSSRMLPRGPAKYSLEGHRAPITVVVTHPVFSLFASGSEDTTIRLWDFETGQYERTLKGHTGYVTGLAFDPRGTILASCSLDLSAKLWDMTTFACTKTLKGHDHTISCIKFVPSGDQVVTCSRDQSLKLWDVSTGYCIKTFLGHTDWIKTLSISIDGAYIASGGIDQSIIIWQISNGSAVQVKLK